VLFFAVVLEQCQPEVFTPLETIITILEQSLVFSTANFVDSLVSHLHDMELVVHDLAFGKWNHFPSGSDKGLAQVHSDRLD
jgi:hypothetical protein